MCEYCDSIGGGELWYLKAENYSRQLYRRKRPGRKFVPDSVSGRKKRDQLLAELNDAFRKRDTLQIPTLKEEAEKAFTAAGVCQVLPLKDCYRIVEIATPVTSMHCVCRKMCRALEERHPDEYSCMGLGVGMLKWERWPERYRGGVNFFSPDDAKAWLKKWDKAGMVHMVMTYGTTTGGIPFIGGLCNCDYPDCLAIRLRADRELKHALLKAHYVAVMDYDLCKGCGTCVKRCQFGAIKMEVTTEKANIDMFKCFGCGVCETGCPTGAIKLERRENFPALKEDW